MMEGATSTEAAARTAFTSTDDAWRFFGDALRREGHVLTATAMQALRTRGIAWSPTEAEDLVHEAIAHLVDHVAAGTADIRPHVGILVQEIRNQAQRVADRHRRRRTSPDPFETEPAPMGPDRTGPRTDEEAIERAVTSTVRDRQRQLHRSVALLVHEDTLRREQWEAFRAVERRSRSGPVDAAVRQRASRCRRVLWPCVATWIEQVTGQPCGEDRSSDRLSAIVQGTGLVRLTWSDLTRLGPERPSTD
jgi:hypothetical protein